MKKEYKKEDFQNLLSKDKILTREEARQHALEKGVIRTVSNSEYKVYCYTNAHSFGWPILPNNFVPVSSYLPQEVVPREGLETGIVSIEEEYAFVYKQGYKLIETIDELVDYLNNTPEVNEMNNRKPKQERKLFPAYFPKGTEVEVEGCLFKKTVRFVVDHIVCNGYQSYVLVAKEDNSEFEGYRIAFNTSHVKRIIKRGTGLVVFEKQQKYNSNDFTKYCNFAVDGKGPGKYSVYAIRDLVYHIVQTTVDLVSYRDMWLNWDALCAAFSSQSFIKNKEGRSFSPRFIDKKRAKRWIKQNVNRFLLSKKEYRKYEEEEEAMYYASEKKWDERNTSVHYPTEVVSQEESHYDSNDGPDYIDWDKHRIDVGGKTFGELLRDHEALPSEAVEVFDSKKDVFLLGADLNSISADFSNTHVLKDEFETPMHVDHETASMSAYNPENLNKALFSEASDTNVPVVVGETVPKGFGKDETEKTDREYNRTYNELDFE